MVIVKIMVFQYHISYYQSQFTMISDSVMANVFLKPIFQSLCHYYRFSLSAPAINKMPSFCAMAKECNIVSFELCSNMLNSQWNGDVFNQ